MTKNILLYVIVGVMLVAVLGFAVQQQLKIGKQGFDSSTSLQPTVATGINIQGEDETVVADIKEIPLTVTQPTNGEKVQRTPIVVAGITTAGAEVFVNDTETKADSRGNFSVSMPIDVGENIIVVIVNDADGKYAQQELTVTYSDEDV